MRMGVGRRNARQRSGRGGTAPSEPALPPLQPLLLRETLRAQFFHFLLLPFPLPSSLPDPVVSSSSALASSTFSSSPIPIQFRKSAPRKCGTPRPPTPTPHLAPRRGEAPLLRSQPSLHSSHSALAERQKEIEMRMSVEKNARKRSGRGSSPITTS